MGAAGARADAVCAPAAPSGGEAHIWLYPQGCDPLATSSNSSCYALTSADGWQTESYQLTGGTALDLTIQNRDNAPMTCAVLIAAIPAGTTAGQLASLTFSDGSGSTEVPFAQFGASCTIPFSPAQSHGVYPVSDPGTTWVTWQVPGITAANPVPAFSGGTGGTRTVHVTADTDGSLAEIHFDAYDCSSGNVNPFSHDLNWIGPDCTNGSCSRCTTPPTIACAGPDAASTGANACSASRTASATASDCLGNAVAVTCAPATVSVDSSAPVSGGVRTATSTCTATDADGNSASCTYTVTLADDSAPSVTCGGQIDLYTSANPGSCAASAAGSASASDNCDGVSASCSTVSLDSGARTGSSTCTATDGSGNQGSCTQSVVLHDDTPPTISCGGTIDLYTNPFDPSSCSGSAAGTAIATDVCDGSISSSCSTAVVGPGSGLIGPGARAETSACSAADGSGNSASCAQSVVLHDITAPVFPPATSCPAPPAVYTSTQSGLCSASYDFSQPHAQDNCDGDLTASCTSLHLAVDGPGSQTATCTATDSGSSWAQCSTTLTLVDDSAPQISCTPGDGSVNYLYTGPGDTSCQAPAAISAVAGDNCDGALQPTCDSMLTLTSANLGTANGATLSCSVADASHNASTCSATFVLVDNTPPGIVLGQPSGQVSSGGAFCNDAPVSVPFTVTDNCACTTWSVSATGGTVTFDPATMSGVVTLPAGNVNGTASATLTVTDCSGNNSQALVTAREQTCFCSYTQGGWGAGCSGGNVACTRDAHFKDVYAHAAANPSFPGATGTTYVAIGNQTTRDLIFNAPKAVDNYLPNGQTPGTVGSNFLDVIGSKSAPYAGTLGGNLLALRMSIDFDAAGYLNRTTSTPLGSLVVNSGPFAGMTLSGFEALAEQVLAGAAPPSGTTASTFSDAASAFNNNFDGCRGNGGLLGRPSSVASQ